MKKTYILVTVFTIILSMVTFSDLVSATDYSGDTAVKIGFIKDTEVKPDNPTVVPPTGGDTTNHGSQEMPPITSGRLPQTGELINYWLIFNGFLLIIMLLFVLGITRENKEESEDAYIA